MDIKLSDEEEFMELAQAGSDEIDPDAPARAHRGSIPIDHDEAEEREGIAAGALVQYAHNGPGFVPTTSTVKTLPPGVYEIDVMNDIPTFVKRDVVTDTLLRLPDSKSDEVIAEVEKFWKLKDKFHKYGFTHKRGFLLWGPPGSGKTCTLAFIMHEMVNKGGVVILGDCNPNLLSGMLSGFRTIEPERPAVVILEDIDTIIENYGESRVLAMLDGESSINNVVFMATTNYPENLDGRVVNRPSRFDRVVKIGMPNSEARYTYLKSRLTELSREELTEWVEHTEGFSIAHMKELIVGVCCFGNSLEGEVKRLKAMAKTPKSDQLNGPVGFSNRSDD